MSPSRLLASTLSTLALLAASTVVQAEAKEITVAYFLEWPMPFEFAKANGTFDKELGVKVNCGSG